MTPISNSSDSRGPSPRTPNDMNRSPYTRGPPQSSRLMSPPSPEILSSNLDNAFPPFPTKKPLPPALKGSNFAREMYAEADSMFAPKSAGLMGTGHLLQRMNSIAPGPFDPKSATGSRKLKPAPAMEALHSARSDGASTQTTSSMSSTHSRSSTLSSIRGPLSGSLKGMPKIERLNGYGGFGPPSQQDDRSQREPLGRAQTFPTENTPTAEAVRPPDNDQNYESSYRDRSVGHDDTDSASPRYVDSSIVSSSSNRIEESATVTPAHYRQQLDIDYSIGNPYHTPNLSSSSHGSEVSVPSLVSSNSSPYSEFSIQGDKLSEVSTNTSYDAAYRTHMPQSIVQTSPQKQSTRNFSDAKPRDQYAKGLQPPKFDMSPSSSPIDPAIQMGRPSPVPPRFDSRCEPGPLKRATTEPAPRRPNTAKGNCKGCGEAIKGRSVSSADGRLTGRYHKPCFVCKTCKEPFSTTTFYVLDDSPYCERHYHQLNGSMCKTCDRGIEGQYLQTERGTKHHPKCLTCDDCKVVLRDDYFEMGDRIYCERDAIRRSRPQGGRGMLGANSNLGVNGSSRMERRTTRLMMI